MKLKLSRNYIYILYLRTYLHTYLLVKERPLANLFLNRQRILVECFAQTFHTPNNLQRVWTNMNKTLVNFPVYSYNKINFEEGIAIVLQFKAQMFGMKKCLVDLYKDCSNYGPKDKIGPAPEDHQFCLIINIQALSLDHVG